MTSAVEVVGKAKSEAVTEIAFDRDVRLLRIGVDEVLGLRIAEGLEASGRKVERVQIILVEKDGLWKI